MGDRYYPYLRFRFILELFHPDTVWGNQQMDHSDSAAIPEKTPSRTPPTTSSSKTPTSSGQPRNEPAIPRSTSASTTRSQRCVGPPEAIKYSYNSGKGQLWRFCVDARRLVVVLREPRGPIPDVFDIYSSGLRYSIVFCKSYVAISSVFALWSTNSGPQILKPIE